MRNKNKYESTVLTTHCFNICLKNQFYSHVYILSIYRDGHDFDFKIKIMILKSKS